MQNSDAYTQYTCKLCNQRKCDELQKRCLLSKLKVPHSTNFGGIKLWQNDRFRVLVRKMLANLQQLTLDTLVNLEFGWVKYWRMTFVLPKFSPTKILRYTVCRNKIQSYFSLRYCVIGQGRKGTEKLQERCVPLGNTWYACSTHFVQVQLTTTVQYKTCCCPIQF